MLRIVIAMASDDFGHLLEQQLRAEHSVVRCFDGNTALDLLQHLHPDVLLIDLSLPVVSGLSVLEQAREHIPGLVIGVTNVANTDVCSQAEKLGIRQLFRLPVNTEFFMTQVQQLLAEAVPCDRCEDDLQRRIVKILQKLSCKTSLTGYQQVLAGIPLVMNDMSIAMCKELYPQIAKILGMSASGSIEHTIRTLIEDAWENGDKALWKRYFPPQAKRKKPYPSNKRFFTTIASMLSTQ